MIAIAIREPGGPEVLIPVERPVPAIGPNDVLIRVAAAGVNRPDVMQRQGRYTPPPGVTDVPGLEVAGTIEACGAEVVGWAVGDRVCALVSGGGYADYCAAPAPQCLPIPGGLDFAQAAALPEVTLHGVDERVRARAVAAGRIDPRSRRIERHRNGGDSACARPGCAGVRHRGQRRKVRSL